MQWWDTEPEWGATTYVLQKPHYSSLLFLLLPCIALQAAFVLQHSCTKYKCWVVYLWRTGLLQCGGVGHVLCPMLMAHPDQAPRQQGLQGVNPDVLAVEDLGTGSGWQQSKQN